MSRSQIARLGGEGILVPEDLPELNSSVRRVLDLMSDGAWHDAAAIRLAAGNGSEASEGLRRMRELRPFFNITRRRGEGRNFQYRILKATREKKMDALWGNLVKKCELCPKLGKHHVPSDGTPSAELMIVGQSPGVNEVKKGTPFIGDSGTLLEGMLAELALSRNDVYIANTLKCRPPKNRPGTTKEKQTCFKRWLKDEIKEVSPRVLLLLGRDAWSMFHSKKVKHGAVVRVTKRTSLIYWYHPAYYLRRGNVGGFMKVAELIKRELER